MDENIFKSNLKTLKEIILDESRLVTYITLSKELCVHVNEAKLLLSKVVDELRTNQPDIDLNVNYIVSGLSDKFSGQTIVCSEADLNRIKQKLEIVFYEHIYSLSKGDSLIDKIYLLASNKLEDLSLCSGLIKNNFCSKRTLDDVGALKLENPKAVKDLNIRKPPEKDQQQKIQVNKQTISNLKNINVNINVSESYKNNEINKSDPENNIKSETPTPKKTIKGNSLLNKNGGKSKSIEVFFNKIDVSKLNNQQKNESTVQEIDSKQEIKVKEEKMDIDDMHTDNNNKSAQTKANIHVKDVLRQIKKKPKLDKKRKRVLHVSDSESDNETEDPFRDETHQNHESEDEIPPTPSVNTIKITSGIVNPKKRRKIIDKTYVDDEGYILTKKEEVYESCSENEEESHKKENLENIASIKTDTLLKENKTVAKTEISPKDKKTKTKKKSPPKGNQPTIMNFFKKK